MTATDRPDPNSLRCPCCSGLVFGECCGPLLSRVRPAPTAQAMMRSRFTAFARGDRDYLLDTWQPDTRPRELVLADDLRWYRLDVESVSAGTPFDSAGEVGFTAYYRTPDGPGTLHELSRFTRVSGRWYYVDGKVG
ncbi:YchJ family protein [Gordonia sp. NPDC003422]